MTRKPPTDILFIGAGASRGARGTFKPPPPLGLELLSFLRTHIGTLITKTWPSALTFCVPTLETASKILDQHPQANNYEELLPLLDRKEREFLHRTVQIFFSDISDCGVKLDLGFRSKPDGYDDLVKKCELGNGKWIVISLNYDLLLEEALGRLGISLYYPHVEFGTREDSKGLAIYKPHGSINFFAQGDHQFSYGGLPKNPGKPIQVRERKSGEIYPEYPIIHAGLPGAKNVLYRANASSLSYPIMANYTAGKEGDVNESALQTIRQEALKHCTSDTEILIVGVNPIIDQNDDPFCAAIFQRTFRSVTYVGVGRESGEKIRKCFPNAKMFENGLREFLNVSV